MIRLFPLLFCFALLGCVGDETLSAYSTQDRIWRLTELNGDPFSTRATLTIPEPGQISGLGPCNSYSASQHAPYPWFEAGPIRTTRKACPDLSAERTFLSALAAMTQSETLDDTLILSNEAGGEMIFTASD